MLKIRLRRTGRKGSPHYRIVVAEHTTKTTGKYVDLVGHYNPNSKELHIKADQIKHWLDNGAKPSNRVAKLLTQEGLKHKHVSIHLKPERKSKSDKGGSKPADAAVDASVQPVATEAQDAAEATEVAAEAPTETPVEEVKEQTPEAPENPETPEENK